MSRMLRCPVALVGCGAISEEYYIPALRKFADVRENVWLVDPSEARRLELAQRSGLDAAKAVGSISDLPSDVRVAFNATPSHLHLPTTLELIARGVSVFVEKPLTEGGEDARTLLKAAEAKGVTLSVNQYRRRFPAYRTVREYLQSGRIGAIQSLTWSEGGKFGWPTQSGFYFRRPWANGQPRGALLDTGAHIVDIVAWWLDRDLGVTSARTDGWGGPEALVVASLEGGGAKVDLRISFLATLSNEYRIEGDRGVIRGSCYDSRRFYFQPAGGAERAVISRGPAIKAAIGDELVGDFVERAISGGAPLIDAASVVRSLNIIDDIYAAAEQPLAGYYKEWAR